jgi:8-hydroxy-5-deazaflavin:NADPH oxidoreductase
MRIGVLGTGIVGRMNAGKLAQLGHDVWLGTRDVTKAVSKTEKDAMGNQPLSEWLKQNPKVRLATFSETAKHGEIVVNAIKGEHSIEGLRMAGEQNLNGKVLMDISNPLDFSKGMPPSLLVSNIDSLGEQIQRAFPKARVVKTLNTVNALLQTEPGRLAKGEHHIFMGGNDDDAKAEVMELLNQYGWRNVIDLGDITAARGTEMMLIIWVRLMGKLGTPMFNFRIVT